MARALSAIISFVFFYAGAVKVFDADTFASSIRGYNLPLAGLEESIAFVLPPLEIVCAVFLFFPAFRRSVLLILGSLCVVFLISLIQAAIRGFEVDCGCFGKTGVPPNPSAKNATLIGLYWAIIRDLFLLASIAWLYWVHYRKNTQK